jgi:hypothetical protein
MMLETGKITTKATPQLKAALGGLRQLFYLYVLK